MSRYLLLAGEAFRLSFQLLSCDALDLQLPQFRGEFAPLGYRRLLDAKSIGHGLLRPEKFDGLLSPHGCDYKHADNKSNRPPDSFYRHHRAMTFGARLKQARKRRKLSQQVLAKTAGISQAALSDLETGETKEARGPTLMALADALTVRPDWLLYGRGGMDKEEGGVALPSGLRELSELWDYVSDATKQEILDRSRKEALPALEKAFKVFEKHGVKGYVSDQRVAEVLRGKKETNKA